jgi:DNA polymerase III subunit delta
MKLAAQRIAGFLRKPTDCRVVLLYGEDAGMIRQRAETLTRAVAGSLDDPFLIAELARDGIGGLADEAASVPLTGGRRVVRVRDVTDAALGAVRAVLSSRAEVLVILEGPGLPARSKLRALLDAAPDGVAIGCYPEEGRALEDTIRQVLGTATVGIDHDALAWLSGQLGADHVSTHAELEKLALYVGPRGRADIDTAMHCVGDAAGLSLDDALFAATAGDIATTDRALELAMAEGASPVSVLRGGLMHLQRLYRARLLVDTGMSAGDAAKAARPPVIYRRTAAFAKALTQWPSGALAAAMAGLSQAERNCKRTGAPDHTLSRHALLTVARRAAGAR